MKKLTLLFLTILPLLFTSCSDDDDNYDNCTSSNLSELLELSVSVTQNNLSPVYLSMASPGKVVVDWGDGNQSIFTKMTGGEAVSHTYDVSSTYNLKISTESDIVKYLYLGSDTVSTSVSEFSFSKTISIDSLSLSYIRGVQSINLDKCQGLRSLVLSNIVDLSSIDGMKSSTQLTSIELRGLPKFTNIDLSENKELVKFSCYGFFINSLSLEGLSNLKNLYLYNTGLIGLNLKDLSSLEFLFCQENEMSNLDVSNNQNLKELICGSNQLESLDLSQNLNLLYLSCDDNKLKNLDVSKNANLQWMNCRINNLENIELTSNSKLERLYADNNNLSAQVLNNIFSALPVVDSSGSSGSITLRIYDNPGYDNCDQSIAINKGWVIF